MVQVVSLKWMDGGTRAVLYEGVGRGGECWEGGGGGGNKALWGERQLFSFFVGYLDRGIVRGLLERMGRKGTGE